MTFQHHHDRLQQVLHDVRLRDGSYLIKTCMHENTKFSLSHILDAYFKVGELRCARVQSRAAFEIVLEAQESANTASG